MKDETTSNEYTVCMFVFQEVLPNNPSSSLTSISDFKVAFYACLVFVLPSFPIPSFLNVPFLCNLNSGYVCYSDLDLSIDV